METIKELIAREEQYFCEPTRIDMITHCEVKAMMLIDNKWHRDYDGYIDQTYYKYYVKAVEKLNKLKL